MPTNTINIPRSTRMRYFNGLFLQQQEFNTDQNFYIGIRHYLNYLLFNPGRLYLDDAIAPLQVSAAGLQLSITPGSALIRDSTAMAGYELEVPNLPITNREFDLSAAALNDGDTLTVTLQREEYEFISTGGGGAGVSPSEEDRTVERALLSVNLPADPPLTPPFITLATITAVDSGGGGAAADTLNVTNTTERGGVRLAILSEEVRTLLGGSGPGTATLTSITISPSGPISIVNGSTQILTATGHFDDGTSHALTAGEGLNWTSSDPSVATIHPTNGTINTVSVGGPVTITASVSAITATLTVTVVAAIPTPVLLMSIPGVPNLPFDPNAGSTGQTIEIFGLNFSVDSPTLPTVEIVGSGGAVLNTFSVSTVDARVSGAVNYEVITGTVGAVSQAVPTPGRLRVTTTGGSAVSTVNFLLLP